MGELLISNWSYSILVQSSISDVHSKVVNFDSLLKIKFNSYDLCSDFYFD